MLLEALRAKRQERKRQGVCVHCGGALKTETMCAHCAERMSRRAHKRKQERLSQGLCMFCGEPRGDSTSIIACSQCRRITTQQSIKQCHARKEQAVIKS